MITETKAFRCSDGSLHASREIAELHDYECLLSQEFQSRFRLDRGMAAKMAKAVTETNEKHKIRVIAGENELRQAILQLLRQDMKIAAIKLYRERTGEGLAAAKDIVEKMGFDAGILRKYVHPSGHVSYRHPNQF